VEKIRNLTEPLKSALTASLTVGKDVFEWEFQNGEHRQPKEINVEPIRD
jgi:hypothetical protein